MDKMTSKNWTNVSVATYCTAISKESEDILLIRVEARSFSALRITHTCRIAGKKGGIGQMSVSDALHGISEAIR
jgi:hypothetical protein